MGAYEENQKLKEELQDFKKKFEESQDTIVSLIRLSVNTDSNLPNLLNTGKERNTIVEEIIKHSFSSVPPKIEEIINPSLVKDETKKITSISEKRQKKNSELLDF